MNHVLITGATGLIGGEIAWRLMRDGHRVSCLVRGNSLAEAAARIESRLKQSRRACDWSKLVPLVGNITQASLGLEDEAIRQLRSECRYVIHCAADTSFAARNHCAEVNQMGTQNVLDLCVQLGKHVRLFHTSSAVACLHSTTGIIREDDSPAGFSNDYVLSKRNTERMVLHSEVDAVVLRPSIVLGHDIQSAAFARSILWVFPVMRRLGVVPLTGDEPIDAVSVAFVADCIVRLLDSKLRHSAYHLSAGPAASATLKEARDVLTAQGHNYRGLRFDPNLDWDDFGSANGAVRRLKAFLDFYLPFLQAGVCYDNERLRQTLGATLPPCPRATEYVGRMMQLFSPSEAFEEALKP
jgi:nucleoside-diphosphate-sugar epimerase